MNPNAQLLTQLAAALQGGGIEVIDLTQTLSPDFPQIALPPEMGQCWPFRIEEISHYDERGPGWYWNNFSCGEHTGTHFDAPAHWISGRHLPHGTVDTLPVQQLVAPAQFEWRGAYAIHALSDAIRAGERHDLIFIDGNHRFDDVLVDFYLADQALRPGGIMAFDDLWMPSVRSAVSFVASNRAYQPVTQPEGNMAVFQKVADDTRDWRHWVPVQVHVG